MAAILTLIGRMRRSEHQNPLRLPREHLPLADGGGDDAPAGDRLGLDGAVVVDSAGTGAWHIGDPPDRRATEAAAQRGTELGGVGRQVSEADFEGFDLLVAMDRSNLRAVRSAGPR